MISQRKHEEAIAAERAYWQGIVTDLLNRIQAPQVAVARSIDDDGVDVFAALDDTLLAADEAERLKLRTD